MIPFTSQHLEAIQEGLELFDEKKYWECHESLEDVWLSDVSDMARYVPWAIIQVAAALYHYHNENKVGAESLLKKSREKLQKIAQLPVDESLLEDNLPWSSFKKLVFQVDFSQGLASYKLLDEFSFLRGTP